MRKYPYDLGGSSWVTRLHLLLLAGVLALAGPVPLCGEDSDCLQVGREVANKGWLLFSAQTPAGDFDLFISRPDGSARRNLTDSREWSEFGARFSPDGKRILYRRLLHEPKAMVNHGMWGAMGELVIANADGSHPVLFGGHGEYPWASWSPDGKQLACLYKREGKIKFIDIASKKVVREMPRQGIFQQLYWSPDGKRLVGTANMEGYDWNVEMIELDNEKATMISRGLNCTPDWFEGDSNRVIYSNRLPGLGSEYGWTTLMQATADGKSRSLVYAERGRHIYYGCTSPDNRYAIFSFPKTDGGTDGPLAIIRLADAPIIVPDDFKEMHALYPNAKSGPVFRLTQPGFEPHWTYAEIGGP
ncbi:MAG: hypothetical protein WCO56_12080 [Verrucomicrobiota bacterium]